jgi:hypothetical protein
MGSRPQQTDGNFFDKFAGLADIIKYAEFPNDRLRGFRSAGAWKSYFSHRKVKSVRKLPCVWVRFWTQQFLQIRFLQISDFLHLRAFTDKSLVIFTDKWFLHIRAW